VLQNELTTARINCQEPERDRVMSVVKKNKNSESLTGVMTQVRGEYNRILQTIGETMSEVESRRESEISQGIGLCDAAK
jgi:hypothetical protein